MTTKDFFPQGIARGGAFLGRENESAALKANIALGHHTLLVAPRRYGKTSLARHVLSELKLPYEEINFYLSRSATSVERKIRGVIQTILSDKLGKSEQIFKSLKSFFSRSKKKWTFGFKGVAGVELTPDNENEPADNIFTVLSLLDATLGAHNKKIVLFLDEFQEIDLIDEGKQVQGAIREFAQQSKNVVFVFSGSNRRLLHHMFDDSSMPLYELCERLKLETIDAEIYRTYINQVALQNYQRALNSDVLEAILSISRRHPKRVYNLCHQLWLTNKDADFSVEDVQYGWNKLVKLRLNDVRLKLSKLNQSQLKTLTLIALGFDKPISGKEAQAKLDLSSAAITRAVRILEDEALIVKSDENQLSIVDPLFESVLAQYESENVE